MALNRSTESSTSGRRTLHSILLIISSLYSRFFFPVLLHLLVISFVSIFFYFSSIFTFDPIVLIFCLKYQMCVYTQLWEFFVDSSDLRARYKLDMCVQCYLNMNAQIITKHRILCIYRWYACEWNGIEKMWKTERNIERNRNSNSESEAR